MNFLTIYILFLAKIITVTFFILLVIYAIFFSKKNQNKKIIKFNILNKQYDCIKKNFLIIKEKCSVINQYKNVKCNIFSKIKKYLFTKHIINVQHKPVLFILNFKGDMQASNVSNLRKEITAIILVAKKNDHVVLTLESSGGEITGYALAAAQLQRLRKQNIYLIVVIDKIAASGGYMMASVANYIIAAPFSIIGSIGVISYIPNFNKFLKDKNITIEQHTSGKFKRTLTLFGENTEEGRKKFCEELNVAHTLFKNFIYQMRPQLNIDFVSNGDHWFGSVAIKHNLIDELGTSDAFIFSKRNRFHLLTIKSSQEKKFLHNILCKIQKKVFSYLLQ